MFYMLSIYGRSGREVLMANDEENPQQTEKERALQKRVEALGVFAAYTAPATLALLATKAQAAPPITGPA
jgi:hypothetical protein